MPTSIASLLKVAVCSVILRWVIYIYICFINTILQMYISQPLPKVVPLLICILTEELSLERSSETGMVLDPPKEIPRWKTTLKAQEAHNRLKSWLFFNNTYINFWWHLPNGSNLLSFPANAEPTPCGAISSFPVAGGDWQQIRYLLFNHCCLLLDSTLQWTKYLTFGKGKSSSKLPFQGIC